MTAVSLVVMDRADEEARALIGKGLDDYNVERSGISDRTPLDVLMFDGDRRVLGGLVGRTSLGVFFIDLFYVPDALRGSGHGTRILAAAEAEAIRRGCGAAVLYTMVIQAPSFYERHGYECFGRIDCVPAGNARVFMKKELR